MSLDFSEDLYAIDHYLNETYTLDSLNSQIADFIQIEYYSQVAADSSFVDDKAEEGLKIPVLESYAIVEYSVRHLVI